MKTENLTKEHAELIRLVNDGLTEIHTKKMEYLSCSADGNPNQEYFKGKADAYEYAYKTFKRILEWIASGSVAAPKEEPKEYITIVTPPEMYWEAVAKSLRDQLREKDELIKELIASIIGMKEQIQALGYYPESLSNSIDSLIKKSQKL